MPMQVPQQAQIPLNQLVEIKALASGIEIIYLTQPSIITLRLSFEAAQELIQQLQVALEAAALMRSQR